YAPERRPDLGLKRRAAEVDPHVVEAAYGTREVVSELRGGLGRWPRNERRVWVTPRELARHRGPILREVERADGAVSDGDKDLADGRRDVLDSDRWWRARRTLAVGSLVVRSRLGSSQVHHAVARSKNGDRNASTNPRRV